MSESRKRKDLTAPSDSEDEFQLEEEEEEESDFEPEDDEDDEFDPKAKSKAAKGKGAKKATPAKPRRSSAGASSADPDAVSTPSSASKRAKKADTPVVVGSSGINWNTHCFHCREDTGKLKKFKDAKICEGCYESMYKGKYGSSMTKTDMLTWFPFSQKEGTAIPHRAKASKWPRGHVFYIYSVATCCKAAIEKWGSIQKMAEYDYLKEHKRH